MLDRFLLPHGINVLTTVIKQGAAADLPAWFGLEVTGRPEFDTSSLAIHGLSAVEEVAITNQALEVLLDALEAHSSLSLP